MKSSLSHPLIRFSFVLLLLTACSGLNPTNPGSGNPSQQNPSDPSTFTANAASPTSANLSWSAVEGATRYSLERKTDNGSYAAVGGNNLTATVFTDNGLSASTSYTYRLKAVNAEGSSNGLEKSLTTPAPNNPNPNPSTAPAVPASLTAVAASSNSINLTWTAVSGATRYALERRTGTGAFSAVGGNNLTSTSFSDSGLSPSTSYTYRISAINGVGSSSPRESAPVNTPALRPSNPTSFSATVVSPSSINLTWTAVSGATRYALERRTGTGAFAAIGGTSLTATSFNDSGLSANTSYTYRLRSVIGSEMSSGLERSLSTPAAPAPAPRNPSLSLNPSLNLNLPRRLTCKAAALPFKPAAKTSSTPSAASTSAFS